MTDPRFVLERVAAEIEAYVGQAGWDQLPMLFALVPTRVLAADPAARAYLDNPDAEIPAGSITPVAQEALPDGPLDEALAGIGWPDEVIGCALTQEILMLPPSAESELTDLDGPEAASAAATHPNRQEARLVVAVLRDGPVSSLLRLRGSGDGPQDLLSGPELAPNLAAALAETLL